MKRQWDWAVVGVWSGLLAFCLLAWAGVVMIVRLAV